MALVCTQCGWERLDDWPGHVTSGDSWGGFWSWCGPCAIQQAMRALYRDGLNSANGPEEERALGIASRFFGRGMIISFERHEDGALQMKFELRGAVCDVSERRDTSRVESDIQLMAEMMRFECQRAQR